jgi:uncharacterized membrane protein YGL010W
MRVEHSRLFEDYAAYHRHPTNKLCHYVGIPLIVFTLVGLLFRASPVAAIVVAALAVLYDLTLSAKLTLAFAGFVLLSFVFAPPFPASALWAGFVVGWVLQFIGHYLYEKKSPAFFENLRQLLVGPLWIVGTLLERPSRLQEPKSSK